MRDRDLLKAYLQGGSESAFAQLVHQYVDLAYAVAQRQLRDQTQAEEVVQLTFCLLAKKARELTEYDSLAGWIYRAAYNISLKTLRDERTRRDREHAIASMDDPTSDPTSEPRWEILVPLLDEAFNQLPDGDRGVLVLRFVQRKAMREVGEALGTTEAAAKMRVGRAIEKVRKFFHDRGIACSSASLVPAMAALSAEAAPAGLSATVAASALASSGAGGGGIGLWAKALFFMAKLKTRIVLIGLGTTAVLMTGSYLLNRSLHFVSPPASGNGVFRAGNGPGQSNAVQAAGFAGFAERMENKIRDAGLARATAKLRAALEVPPRKGTRSYPSSAVEDAVAAFGPYQEHAFGILKAAVEGDNQEARSQAVAALGRIGKNVPAAKELLWKLLRSGEDPVSFYALSSLGNSGFLPEDLGTLAAMIPGQTDQLLVRYLPEQIARAIQRDPEAMKPYLGPVEALLQDADPAVRFSAACALAEVRGAQDPEIVKGLTAGLAISDRYRLRNEATGEVVRHLMALETLQRMGPPARAALPELQAFVRLTPDSVIREVALRTIGAIDPEIGGDLPEVQSVLAKDERRASLAERLQAGTYAPEDLTEGLQEPFTVSLAASRLAELGPGASRSVPELVKAMAGKDEATRDEVLAAIKAIDPKYVVERVPREPVAQGALAARLELETLRGELDGAAADALDKLIDPLLRGNTTWYTRSEIGGLTAQLRKENLQIWKAFLAKASAVDPAFEQVLPQP